MFEEWELPSCIPVMPIQDRCTKAQARLLQSLTQISIFLNPLVAINFFIFSAISYDNSIKKYNYYMLAVKNKKPVLRALAILLAAIGCSLLFYCWENHHVRNYDYTITSKDSIRFAGRVIGETKNGIAVDVQSANYQKNIYFLGDTANLSAIKVVTPAGIVIIPASTLILATAAPGFAYLPAADVSRSKVYLLTGHIPKSASRLPGFKEFINWGGDAALLRKSVFNPFVLSVFVLLLLTLTTGRKISTVWDSIHNITSSSIAPAYALQIQVLLFLILFVILLLINPYYFLHDDNYAQFQPVINFSMEEFYKTGRLPVYNPYQFAGVPTLPQSIYGLFYPFTHLSYLISVHVLGSAVHFTTVFCLLHFFIGYWFTCRLLKHLKVSFLLATLAALCFIFSGVNLVFASSWYYAAPVMAWLPVVAFIALRLTQHSRGLKYWLWLTAVFTLFAYSGNIQFCVYTMLLFGLFWLLSQSVGLQTFLRPLLMVLAVVLLFMPQWLVALPVIKEVSRTAVSTENTYPFFHKVVFPVYNQVLQLGQPAGLRQQHEISFYNHQFLFSIAAFAVLFYGLIFGSRSQWFRNRLGVLLLLFLTAVLLSLGKAGLLWPMLSKLPVFNKFQHPFKFLIFINYFAMLIGVLAVQRWILLNRQNSNRRIAIQALVVFFSASALLLTFFFQQLNFNLKGYTRPYAVQPWMKILATGNQYRIYAAGTFTAPNQAATLQFNFGTQYRIVSIDGWEELNGILPNPLQYAREYGVRYYVLSNGKDYKEGLNINMTERNLPLFDKVQKEYQLIYRDSVIQLYEDVHWQPLVQLRNDTAAVVLQYTIEYNAQGAVIQLPQPAQGNLLTLAFINRPGLYVYLDDQPYSPAEDAAKRVVVRPVKPFRQIRLVYEPYKLVGW
jgi:hypothetical protein